MFEKNMMVEETRGNMDLLLELFSMVPRTLTPDEERILNDAMEHSASLHSPVEWHKFVSRLIETKSVKIMTMFWKLFNEFDIITDSHVKNVLINALKVGIRSAIQKRPERIEDINDPSLLKYYKAMLPDYQTALKMQ